MLAWGGVGISFVAAASRTMVLRKFTYNLPTHSGEFRLERKYSNGETIVLGLTGESDWEYACPATHVCHVTVNIAIKTFKKP